MNQGLAFPQIDPVIFAAGPLAVRWYSLAYIAGIVGGWLLARKNIKYSPDKSMTTEKMDDFITWATFAIILGGRLGYVLFYNFGHYLANPADILQVWQGGMSFHGGFLGLLVATIVFSRLTKIDFAAFADLLCTVGPVGLFFGRIANFINGELYGRVATDVPWAVRFPAGGYLPRHPSQLYEALAEGVLLFIVVNVAWRYGNIRQRKGFCAGLFMAGYGLCRFALEYFREPDAHIGFLAAGLSMGQWLTLPMLVAGVAVMFITNRKYRQRLADDQ